MSITYFELTGRRCTKRVTPKHQYRCNGPGLTVYEIRRRLNRDVRFVRCIRQAVVRHGQAPRLELLTRLGEIIDYGPL